MAQTFNERFETGPNGTALSTGNTAFSGGVNASNTTVTFDSTSPILGAFSAKIVQTANFGTCSLIASSFTSVATQYASIMMTPDVLPTGGSFYFIYTSTATPTQVARVGINASGNIIINDAGSVIATSTTVLTAGTQYRIEWDSVGTSEVVRLYAGAASTTLIETVSGTSAGSSFTHFVAGIANSANTNQITIHLDELTIDSAANPGAPSKAATATGSTADGGTGTARGAATATGSTADGGTATSKGVATAAGSTASTGSTISASGSASASGGTSSAGSGTARAAVTVTGGTIVTGTASATNTKAATATGGTITTGLANATFPTVLVFRPPFRDFDPPIAEDTPLEQISPAIYFTDLIPKGINVFVTLEGVLTEEQPEFWEDVDKVYWGGHENYVTTVEAATISAVSAEYAACIFTIPAGPGTPAPTGTGSGSGSGSGDTTPPVTDNYGDGNYGDGNYG